MRTALVFLFVSAAALAALRATDFVEVRGSLKMSGYEMTIPKITTHSGKEATAKVTRKEGRPYALPEDLGITFHCKATVLSDGKIAYSAFLTNTYGIRRKEGNPTAASYTSRKFVMSGTTESGKAITVDGGDGATIELVITERTREEIFKPRE